MQNNQRVYSKDFVEKFKKALVKTYHYKEYMDFLIVPSLTFSKILSYIPALSYTDRTSDDIDDLIELSHGNNYQIKTLNFKYNDFKDNDPVTMRLSLNKEMDLLNCYKSRTRNYVRKSLKNSFELRENIENLDDFYIILRKTYKKHGAPLISKKLFLNLFFYFREDLHLFTLYKDNQIAAAMFILKDKELSWYGWGGVDEKYAKERAGYCIYHLAIENMLLNHNIKIFDFGRSPYNGGTYRFKSHFGAKPVKIDIFEPIEKDIYSTYSRATTLYKKLPFWISDRIGPVIRKHFP